MRFHNFAQKNRVMKKIWFVNALAVSFLAVSCGGQEETTEENVEIVADSTEVVEENALTFDGVERGEYTLFGYSDINADAAATVDEMLTQYDETGEFNDKVQVSIASVCQMAGCWITFNDSENNEIRVFFRDHFTIPIETVPGTEAILLGELYTDTVSVEMQKHLMEDDLKEGEELDQKAVAKLKEKIALSFDCESILVKK